MKESEKNFDDAKMEKSKKDFNKLRDRFSKPKINEIRKGFYEIENKKKNCRTNIKEIEKHPLELEKNLSKLK